MSKIHVGHIRSNCQARFSSLIDMADVKTANLEQRECKLLSRAVAAFTIGALAKVDDITAAQSVVDEFHDDGIDAFYFDRTEHVAYLVQSKWIEDGNGSPDLGSILKFIKGINDFLGNKLSQLGPKMQAKAIDIQEALADSQATFILVVAYTGKQPLAIEVSAPLSELLQELNDDGDLVSLRVLKQKELHDVVEAGVMGTSVDLTVMLHEFGRVAAPYQAWYGHVHVTDLATWGKYGDRLYHKNIRGFKGSTDVNDSIVETLRTSPQHFLYFNNGITLLCSEIDKQPLGGSSKTSGVFECKGASVINGAQTVGSILTALAAQVADGSVVGADGRVMVRLISLENCPQDFANDVTRAANTQNRIEKRDFAALDKEQYRLRSELLLSLEKDYVYRAGDLPPSPDKGCTLEDATVALACAQPDATHAVNAKQAIGRFFEDTTKAPYTILFNSSLTALKLWRAVEMLRTVDEYLKQEQKKREGKEKLCAIHGNRVVLHLVFKKLGDTVFEADNIAPYTSQVPGLATTYLEQMAKEMETTYATSYVGNVFKNIKKCKEMISKIAP